MDNEKFMNMVYQALEVEPVTDLNDRPQWVLDFVMREKVINRLLVLHYQEIASQSGVYEGANELQIDSYKNDLASTTETLMSGEDAYLEESFHGKVAGMWNPSNEYPGTRITEFYDTNGKPIKGGE
tara:strand:- start:36 stop:413 length:378 start_codon:yes stop_codon:yes gene_type:complete